MGKSEGEVASVLWRALDPKVRRGLDWRSWWHGVESVLLAMRMANETKEG